MHIVTEGVLYFALSPSSYGTAPSRREPWLWSCISSSFASIFEGGGTMHIVTEGVFVSLSPFVIALQ